MADKKITKETLVADALNLGNAEKVAVILQEAGLHCFGCALAHQETVGDIAMVHNVDIDDLVEKLNAAVEG
ncbi:MAG: DUF1858 domain-containing protein [Clostridia bacterium]|nr:DUF1858 domain-containing protein [Clostridia bacterium]